MGAHEDDGGKKRKRFEQRVRSQPVRAAILELFERNEGRSRDPADIQRDLPGGRTPISSIAYHMKILEKAGLIPEAG